MTPGFTDSAFENAWPFWVLELPSTAKAIDIEKAAREINAKMQLKVPGAEEFPTPNGKRKRDEFLVREAKAKLLNPEERLLAEFWYMPTESSENDVTEPNVKKNLEEWRRILGVRFWASLAR